MENNSINLNLPPPSFFPFPYCLLDFFYCQVPFYTIPCMCVGSRFEIDVALQPSTSPFRYIIMLLLQTEKIQSLFLLLFFPCIPFISLSLVNCVLAPVTVLGFRVEWDDAAETRREKQVVCASSLTNRIPDIIQQFYFCVKYIRNYIKYINAFLYLKRWKKCVLNTQPTSLPAASSSSREKI